MTALRVSIDLSQVLEAFQAQSQAILKGASKAVNEAGNHAKNHWMENIWKAHLWTGEKMPYFKSIGVKPTGPYSVEIWTDFPLAGEIETGRPAKDLKKVLPTAKKARQVLKGKHAGQKYLIIPFRHNTPGQTALAKAMPQDIYAKAKALSPSVALQKGNKMPATRLSATGHMVAQHSYQWGGKLPAGLAPKLKAHHTTDIYAGMVKMNTSSGKQKSSAYLTFRIMGEWQSDKWIVEPRPGQNLAGKAAESAQKMLDDAIGKIIEMESGLA